MNKTIYSIIKEAVNAGTIRESNKSDMKNILDINKRGIYEFHAQATERLDAEKIQQAVNNVYAGSMYFVTNLNNIITPDEALALAQSNDDVEYPIAYDVNWEDPDMMTDGGTRIEPAYGDDSDTSTSNEIDPKKPVEYPQGRLDDPGDENTYHQMSKEKEDIFERLVPMQLNALMETLVRNKKRFNQLYEALAVNGFVPLNEGADYDTKKSILNEMLKDSQLTKQMLETLVEMNHIQIGEGPLPDPNTTDDYDQLDGDNPEMVNPESNDEVEDNEPDVPVSASDPDSFGATDIADYQKPGRTTRDDAPDEPVIPKRLGEPDAEITGDLDYSKLGNAKREYETSLKDMRANLAAMKEYTSLAGFESINKFLVDIRHNYNTYDDFTKEVADEMMTLVNQQKDVQQKAIGAQKVVRPRVYQPQGEMEPIEAGLDEAKQSELALRAGAKGKIFESRLKKLESYKKVALLEFLENDPHMMDDQDYTDMAMLTGISEGDIIAMRMEYEAEILGESMNYPVFGGQDVRGENEKNEKKALTRDIKATQQSQKTTEEKVYEFKVKKFSLEDAKTDTERNGQEDQNRGMHTQVDVLNQQNPANKETYKAQADGVFGKRDPKEVKNDAGVGDGKVYGSEGTTDVGEDLLKKGEAQPGYYASTSNEKDLPPHMNKPNSKLDHVSQPIRTKVVNEDLDRMKGLFSYSPDTYNHPRVKVSPNVMFGQQLKDMKVLSESVETIGRPSKQQLSEMKIVEFEGKEARTDGESYFDNEGKKVGECNMKEARNNQLKTGLAIQPKQLKAGTKPLKEYDLSKIDEGTDTGKMCTECNHKIREMADGSKKCMCKGEPKAEKEDLLERQIARQNQLAGITENKRNQLRHTKGTQLRTGTKEELVETDGEDVDDKNKNLPPWLQKKKGEDGTEKPIDEAKHMQLAHSKGHQIQTGTKVAEDKK